jgi:hypothetical protein
MATYACIANNVVTDVTYWADIRCVNLNFQESMIQSLEFGEIMTSLILCEYKVT